MIRHANVQRSALIKAIPAPAPSFYPARERVEHVRDPIVLFDCGLFFPRKGISFLFPLERERDFLEGEFSVKFFPPNVSDVLILLSN